ncbi:unnamed protein product [Toxocara canis]|uniref:Uncharacterized protein n=1 Tax=Toxocara canis TaxID=6265 RepID=A0A183U3N1_TOXCA|nr:unnamed protein product [Toxocara canis]
MTNLINKKNEQRTQLIQRSVPVRAKEEEELNEEMTKDAENFLEVWLQGQEEIEELQENLDEVDQQLRDRNETPSADTHQEALPNDNTPHTLRIDTTNVTTDAQENSTTAPPATSRPSTSTSNITATSDLHSEFWEFFRDAVHRQNTPPVQKYHCLLGCLKWRAHAATEGLSVTSANYPEVDIIKSRIGNPITVRLSLYNQLRKVRVCTMRTKDLRGMLEAVEKCYRQLKAPGKDTNRTSIVLITQEKLPPCHSRRTRSRKNR